jgi:hypothetical protein
VPYRDAVLPGGRRFRQKSLREIGADVQDIGNRWAEKYRITDSGAVLVRPDGIIAWRAADANSTPKATLQATLAGILGKA